VATWDTAAPTSWVSCSATKDCVTRYRLPVTDGVTKTVNNGRLGCSRLCCLAPHPLRSLRFSLPSFATPPKESTTRNFPQRRNPEVELHLPHLSSTCTHTCTHDPRGDPAAPLTTYEITASCR